LLPQEIKSRLPLGMNITSRLPDIGTSIFTVMSKMALEHGAINLSQGFPDFPIDPKLIDLVSKAMRDGHNQYAPMPGVPALKQKISELIKISFGAEINPDTEIVIGAGATEAIYSTMAALIETGDEVIVFDPSYDSYDPAIRLNGGVPIHINLNPPDFSIPWDFVHTKITKRTKAILVNSPHNPTGSVLSNADMMQLTAIANEFDLLVFSDEVYERIIFDGHTHCSVLKYPELKNRSVAFFSFGKTFHSTGWKIGYTVATPVITTEIRKAHQFVTFAVNTPIQVALSEYLNDHSNIFSLGKFFQAKRDFFLEQIKGCSFKPLPCTGSYFQLLSFERSSKEGDVQLAERLTKEMKVASIPVSVFYKDQSDHNLLRFCFAKKEETLEKAGEILRKL
jgi:methionine transaminase